MDRIFVVALATGVAYWFGFQESDTANRIFLFTLGTLPWLLVLPRLIHSLVEGRSERRLTRIRNRLERSRGA